MADITIDDRQFKLAASALSLGGGKFKALAGRTVAPTLRKSGNIVRQHVRTELIPHRRSGKTSSHVESRAKGTGLNTVVTVKAANRTAHLLEGGTTAHDEFPRGSRGVSGGSQLGGSGHAMTVRGAGASNGAYSGFGSRAVRSEGQVVAFVSHVHHPGTRADPFFERGVTRAGPEVQVQLNKAVTKMAADLASTLLHVK